MNLAADKSQGGDYKRLVTELDQMAVNSPRSENQIDGLLTTHNRIMELTTFA